MTLLIVRTLEELDGAEARLVLLDLPPMDVDRVSHLPDEISVGQRVSTTRGGHERQNISLLSFITTAVAIRVTATRYDATYR